MTVKGINSTNSIANGMYLITPGAPFAATPAIGKEDLGKFFGKIGQAVNTHNKESGCTLLGAGILLAELGTFTYSGILGAGLAAFGGILMEKGSGKTVCRTSVENKTTGNSLDCEK